MKLYQITLVYHNLLLDENTYSLNYPLTQKDIDFIRNMMYIANDNPSAITSNIIDKIHNIASNILHNKAILLEQSSDISRNINYKDIVDITNSAIALTLAR
jgi:hypothetical protein